MAKMQPREYQIGAVKAVFDYFEIKSGNPIIYVAGGGGKSFIIALLIQRIFELFNNQRIVISASSQDLVSQNYAKLAGLAPNVNMGIYSSGLGKKQPWASVVYGGIQSMYNKSHQLGCRDLLLIDECQDLSPKDEGMYMSFINDLKKINPFLKVIGFSATPWRMKGGSLIEQDNAIFTDIIYEVTQKFLTEEGYLTPLVGKSSIIQGDTSKLKAGSNNEFNMNKVESIFNNEDLMIRSLNDIDTWAKDRSNFLFFTSGIEHGLNATRILNERNYNATWIDGKTNKKTVRPQVLESFRLNGFSQRQSLVNNAVLTTGTDLPNVDCIVLWRSTASAGLYVQILSRGTRPVYAPGYDLSTREGRLAAIANGSKPNCLVLCFAGNVERFGAIDLIQIPTGKNKKNNGQPKIAPQKICPKCREPQPIMTKQCACGYEFEFDESVKHSHTATMAAVSSFEIKPEKYTINNVIYKTHISKKGNPCLRVQYYDIFGFITSEYVAFSNSYAKEHVEKWYSQRKPDDKSVQDWFKLLPKGTSQAFAMRNQFKKPKYIYAKKSGKYMEVTDYEF